MLLFGSVKKIWFSRWLRFRCCFPIFLPVLLFQSCCLCCCVADNDDTTRISRWTAPLLSKWESIEQLKPPVDSKVVYFVFLSIKLCEKLFCFIGLALVYGVDHSVQLFSINLLYFLIPFSVFTCLLVWTWRLEHK